MSYPNKYPNENPYSIIAFSIPKLDKQLQGHEPASAMSSQQGELKIVVNLHALSNNKGRKLASAVEATCKKVHECEKRVQSAASSSSKSKAGLKQVVCFPGKGLRKGKKRTSAITKRTQLCPARLRRISGAAEDLED